MAVSNSTQLRTLENRAVYRALKILEGRLRTPGIQISSPDAVRTWLRLHLADQERENFFVMFLDTQHRLIAWEILFRGSIDGASVYAREVVKAALKHNAAAVMFAHNHPSGVGEPSDADRGLTDRLKEALQLVDIRVLDHFVIGSGVPVSFKERGWI